jgi:hypothetical protein
MISGTLLSDSNNETYALEHFKPISFDDMPTPSPLSHSNCPCEIVPYRDCHPAETNENSLRIDGQSTIPAEIDMDNRAVQLGGTFIPEEGYQELLDNIKDLSSFSRLVNRMITRDVWGLDPDEFPDFEWTLNEDHECDFD